MSPPRRPVRHPALGAALRRVREAADISGNALAKQLGWAQPKISMLETGRQTPTEGDIAVWAAATGADPAALLAERELALVRRLDIREAARRPGGVEALQGDLENLEAGSTTIVEYQPTLIPGLAQTPAYTRAWLSTPDRVELGGPVDVDAIVTRRTERQRRLHEHTIVVVLTSMALASAYGGPEVQREQLEHLAGAATRSELELVVVGTPIALLHGFELLDDAVVIETVAGATVMSDPEVVAMFTTALRSIRQQGRTGARALDAVHHAADALDDLSK